MAKVITDEQNYQDIAAAIRAKLGSSDTYTPSEMAAAIGNISGGGGGSSTPLDSEAVYLATRPADWLKMPTPGDDEMYFLLQIDDDYTGPVAICFESAACTLEFGTSDQNGNFIADSSMTYQAPNYNVQTSIPSSKFGSPTAEGKKQIIMKASGAQFSRLTMTTDRTVQFRHAIAELSAKLTSTNIYNFIGSGNSNYYVPNMRYISVTGGKYASYAQSILAGCSGLIAVRSLPSLSQLTSLRQAFMYCSKLIAVCALDTSGITDYTQAFSYCTSLSAAPAFNTANGTVFDRTFDNCSKLTTTPAWDFSSATNLNSCFSYCQGLKTASLTLNSATNLSTLFNNCSALTSVTVNAPNATNWYNTFSSCRNIETVSLVMTSAQTIPEIPSTSLKSLAGYDTSSAISMTVAVSNFLSKDEIEALGTSNATNFSNAIGYSRSLFPCHLDLSSWDFSAVTSSTGLNNLVNVPGGTEIVFGDTFGASGIINVGTMISASSTYYAPTSDSPVHIKINKTDAMLQLAANATTVFSGNSYIYVYVPDNLLATYQADTYWSTLGARLKGFSEWPS